jgi:hypothetical protein
MQQQRRRDGHRIGSDWHATYDLEPALIALAAHHADQLSDTLAGTKHHHAPLEQVGVHKTQEQHSPQCHDEVAEQQRNS